MSRPVVSRPSDRATVGGGVPPISTVLIPRLHKDIPEPGSDLWKRDSHAVTPDGPPARERGGRGSRFSLQCAICFVDLYFRHLIS